MERLKSITSGRDMICDETSMKLREMKDESDIRWNNINAALDKYAKESDEFAAETVEAFKQNNKSILHACISLILIGLAVVILSINSAYKASQIKELQEQVQILEEKLYD